jgi:hypothetical protein
MRRLPRQGIQLGSCFGVMPPSQTNYIASIAGELWTFAEAGWSWQSPIFDARCEPGGALAMGRAGESILLLCRASAGSAVQLYEGRYLRKCD